MTYTFHQLGADDLAAFKDLLHVFGKAFEDLPTYQDAVPRDAYLKALLEKPHFIVVVAKHGEEVIAGLAAYVLEKFEQERSEVYIYDLAVDERHRRRGVATGLINELKKAAREKNAYIIFVQADSGDTPAISLYESLGTREDVHHFDIRPD